MKKIIYLMHDLWGNAIYYARGKSYKIKNGCAFGKPMYRSYGCATDDITKATKATIERLQLLQLHYPEAEIMEI